MSLEKVGRYAFIVGLVISVIAGIAVGWLRMDTGPIGVAALAILGIIVGFLNVTGEETDKFLRASIALILVGWAGASVLSAFGSILTSILSHFVAFIIGATLIVALKEVLMVAQKQ